MHNSNDNTPKNSIVNFAQSNFTMEELDEHLKLGRKALPQVASNIRPYMKMSKDGDGFFWGQENIQTEEGALWVINSGSFQKGWVAWNNGKKLPGEVLGSIANPPALPDIDYSHLGAEWQEQYAFELTCLEGDDEDQTVLYVASSLGGRKAYRAIYDASVDRPYTDFWQPVVLLEVSSYPHKKFKTLVYEPVFRIVDWADNDQRLHSEGGNIVSIENAPEAGESVDPVTAPDVNVKRKQRKQRTSAA